MNNFKNDPKKKRYYWLQLKENFFNQKEIKLLRRVAGGDTYTIIYLKMLLLSLKDEGRLFYEAIGDNFPEEVALSLDESPEDIAITISFLEKKQLLEVVEHDEYFLNRVPELIGSESYSAKRVREHRGRKKEQEELQGNVSALQSNNGVTQVKQPVTKRRYRDREDIEIDIELDNIPSSDVKIPYQEIIEYLNQKANKKFKVVQKHKDFIKARWNEGQRMDDFKKVVDNMVANWTGQFFEGKPAENYLQPSTLFGNKFDQYLNQKPKMNVFDQENGYDPELGF